MRFTPVPASDGWGVWDGATNGWRVSGVHRREAEHQALELNLSFDQYGPRPAENRRRVEPAVEVDSWAPAGAVEWWVREGGDWLAPLTDTEGQVRWIRAADLRRRPWSAAPDPSVQDQRRGGGG